MVCCKVRPLDIHKLADDDVALHTDIDIARARAVLDNAVLLVEAHGVKPVAHLVAPLVERGAGRE